ncbi:unnamed protein product [Coccothraustes coccothraustes]
MREPVSSIALPAAGAERRGAASASIPLLCASGPCGHSDKGRYPFRGRGSGGRFPLHPLLGPASVPSPSRGQNLSRTSNIAHSTSYEELERGKQPPDDNKELKFNASILQSVSGRS